MKKKLFLAVLPALLVLSGCKSPYSAAATKVFKEDTIAHEEIFGEAEEIDYFGKKGPLYRNPGEAITAPKIGYQIKYDSGTGKLAIRFVAAINDLNVKAYWRRGVAAPDGSEVASFNDAAQQVTKYYRTITDGPSTITAGSGSYVDYQGFVVYTLYNIPYSSVKDNYVAAYLNLVGDETGKDNGAGGTYDVHNNSVALAVSIERKTETVEETELKNVFTFNPTMNKHFLQGTINDVVYDGGVNGLYEESGSTPSGNYAWYENIVLKNTDSFGSFYYDHDRVFLFFGHDNFTDHTDYFDESSLSGYNKPVKSGTYKLYLSSDSGKENHIFATASSIESGTKYTIRLQKGTENGNKWDIDSAWFAVYMFNDTENTWRKMSSETGYYELTNYDPNVYTGFIICRMKKEDTSTLSWGNKNNQSRNLYIYNLAGFVSYFKLAAGDPWDNNENDYFSITA